MRRLFLVLVTTLLCLPLGQALPTASAAPAEPVAAVQPQSAATVVAKRGPYTCWRAATATCRISGGVTFSSANGNDAQKWAIINRIVSTIRRTPSNASIQIMSWNIMSRGGVSALIDAANRGVRVRVLMDGANRSKDVPNPGFTRLVKGLRAANRAKSAAFPKARYSYAKTCQGSCRRGKAASAHAKYYMFSKVGASRNVVMQGSANLTAAAASNQWNDLVTYTENAPLYSFFNTTFVQMWQDRYVSPSWRQFKGSTFEMYFSPRLDGDVDPLTYQLQRVRCTGTTAGRNGRTVIRAAPDVFRGTWGMTVAKLLRKLWNEGCDIKIGYTVIGVDVKRYISAPGGRGPVPHRQLAQDVDGDKVLDKYFHLKAWTINGRSIAGGTDDKSYYWMMQGSSNVSDLSKISDENIGVFKYASVTLKYQNYIDRWFTNPPRSRPVIPSRVPKNVDPYAKMEMD